MRVLIPVPELPIDLDKIKGGVHSALANLLKGFAMVEVQVRVISFTREVKQKRLVQHAPNIEISYVPEGPWPFHSLNYFINGPSIMKKEVSAFNPDIIHFEEGNSFLFTRLRGGLLGKKFLLTIHGMAYDEAKRKKKLLDKLTWYFNGWVQRRLTPSNIIHLSDFSRKKLQGISPKHETIIPNAVVPAWFNVPLKDHTDNTILYMGVIDNNKNLIFLLGALKKLVEVNKPFSIEVLGDFNNEAYKAQVLDYIHQHALLPYVKLNGWVTQSTALKFMAKADILVVSSKHESLPMVIAESMAAGKVVAASDVGGIPEMITDRSTGFLFNLEQPGQLVNILEELHGNDTLIISLSRKARALAIERYQCQNVAKRTIGFYNKCLQP
jgi:glycosyltransferase involved in cell wall biosynthesis